MVHGPDSPRSIHGHGGGYLPQGSLGLSLSTLLGGIFTLPNINHHCKLSYRIVTLFLWEGNL